MSNANTGDERGYLPMLLEIEFPETGGALFRFNHNVVGFGSKVVAKQLTAYLPIQTNFFLEGHSDELNVICELPLKTLSFQLEVVPFEIFLFAKRQQYERMERRGHAADTINVEHAFVKQRAGTAAE